MTDLHIDKKKDKVYACSNCGFNGHDYKHCKEPITSWGILLVKLSDKSFSLTSRTPKKNDSISNMSGVRIDNLEGLKNICDRMKSINFLLVRRKHSLGYVEFVRGRYMKDNIEGIIYLFRQMVPSEIKKIASMNFDDIWNDFWASDAKKQYFNKKEYSESKEKFESLKNGDDVELTLDFYIQNVKPDYTEPEWGFPKGRRTRGESDMECATREFCEETGFVHSDIKIISYIKPIVENIIGTNGVSYRHIYYLAEATSDVIPESALSNNNEIGDIGYYTYEDTMRILREYHIEKKKYYKKYIYVLFRIKFT